MSKFMFIARTTGRMPNFVVNDDVVDLVSSPFLIVPGTVTLDSDEELEEIRSKTNAGVDSPQFDTNEVNVKVACGSTIEEFPFRRVCIFPLSSNRHCT